VDVLRSMFYRVPLGMIASLAVDSIRVSVRYQALFIMVDSEAGFVCRLLQPPARPLAPTHDQNNTQRGIGQK
jgi:hypothetical protein